jgi:deoxyribodipyrimidine photo-lyase
MSKKAIYWFRNNLRLKDNPSLYKAIHDNNAILPVYVINEKLFEKHPLGFSNCGVFRLQFLYESLIDLRKKLKELGGELLILVGNPAKQIETLAQKHQVKDIYATREFDYYELQEERHLSKQYNLHFEFDQLLLNPQPSKMDISKLPLVFTNFRKSVEKNMSVRSELPTPEKIKVIEEDYNAIPKLATNLTSKDNRSAFPFKGGEQSAWKRLNQYFWDTGKLAYYKKTRNGLIGPDYSSKFSPYLALGCISPVSIYRQVKKFETQKLKNISTYWLIFEILWREFFKLTSWKYGKQLFHSGGILDKKRVYKNDESLFNEWISGNTGDDFVNANMQEIKETGFMSNRGRQNVASYLVHDLEIDWRWGASYFESQLIDYDCASNWCNWMYVAGVGNDPRSRKFNTKLQAEKYDPKGKYRNLWNQPGLFD